MKGHFLRHSVESGVSAFSGGLLGNHHLSVSDDLLSIMFENYLLHHWFKLCLSFKSSQDGKWAQSQREWKREVCGSMCVITCQQPCALLPI